MTVSKESILATLHKFTAQRAGLKFANYGDITAYRAEKRSITKDRHHAEALLGYIARRDSITANDILQAAQGAFSGRLSITTDGDKVRIDYTTGQYFPTEYRRAVCAVASSAIWARLREDAGQNACGDDIRRAARRELGASLARRWFN